MRESLAVKIEGLFVMDVCEFLDLAEFSYRINSDYEYDFIKFEPDGVYFRYCGTVMKIFTVIIKRSRILKKIKAVEFALESGDSVEGALNEPLFPFLKSQVLKLLCVGCGDWERR